MAEDDSKGDVKRPVEEGWETARPKKKRKAAQILAVDINGSYSPGLADVQSLLLRIFTEQYGENPRWLCVRGMNLVKCCRVVLLPCLESTVVLNRPASAPFLTSLLRSKNRVAMKTSSEVEHFPKDQGAADAGSRMLLSLLAARAKPTVAKKAKAPAKVQPGASEAKVPIRDYLVSEEARNRSGYPDKSFCGKPGWIVLPERSDLGEGQLPGEHADEQASLDPDAKHLAALDCEMVMLLALASDTFGLPGGELA
ncbi:ABCG24 [Symbiodinium necroappetens]|uniref:ABCG24 protein n=1 Tax=Symbiodinium necroappetens TaxID=1628268 RepID=A0A812Z121_9DINO|nr:ABCG24 [Symbiodinium necroappetens]